MAPVAFLLPSASLFIAKNRLPLRHFHCKDLLGHTEYVETVEFFDDGTLLATGGLDSIVRMWPISGQEEVETHLPSTDWPLHLWHSTDHIR